MCWGKRGAKSDEDGFNSIHEEEKHAVNDFPAFVPDIDLTLDSKQRAMLGRTASVHVGLFASQEVAIKSFRYSKLTPTIRRTFDLELAVLRHVNMHNNIVKCLAACTEPKHGLHLVLEKMDGNLQQLRDHSSLHVDATSRYIHADAKVPAWMSVPYDLHDVKHMAVSMARGIQALHRAGFLHRDLKPHNVLIRRQVTSTPSSSFDDTQSHGSKMELKLCDFGLTVPCTTEDNFVNERVGTSGWAAPEVMKGVGYSFPADIFSAGQLLWAMLSPGAVNEFQGMTSSGYYQAMSEGERPKFTEAVQASTACDEIRAVVHQCWELDPARRPTADELVSMLTAWSLE